jgi:hypothetical protein
MGLVHTLTSQPLTILDQIAKASDKAGGPYVSTGFCDGTSECLVLFKMTLSAVATHVAFHAILAHHEPAVTMTFLANLPFDFKLTLSPIDSRIAIRVGDMSKFRFGHRRRYIKRRVRQFSFAPVRVVRNRSFWRFVNHRKFDLTGAQKLTLLDPVGQRELVRLAIPA